MRVGFIGLGNVGGKLAGSLLRNGVDLYVYDLEARLVAEFDARGASDGRSPAQLMQICDTVITCLSSPAASAADMDAMSGKGGRSNRERGCRMPSVRWLSPRGYGEYFNF